MKAYVLCLLISSFIVGSNAAHIQFLRNVDAENTVLEITTINADESEFIAEERRDGRDNFKCPYEFGAFPDPKDCSCFFVCKKGRSSHQKCQRNMLFDVHRRTCLPRWLAVCGDGKEGTRNPQTTSRTRSTPKNDDDFKCNSLYGSYAHPTKCEKYYTCVLFKATLQTCPKSQLFDAVKKTCMKEDKVHCGNRERPFGSKTTPTEEITTEEAKTETIEIKTEEPTTEIETEEPTAESTTEIETEEPTAESTTEIKTEEPTTESTTEIPTEEPTTEIPTEEPTTESTTEIPTEEPTTESTTEIPTEEPTTAKPTGPPETDCDEEDVDCIITETGEVSDWFTCPEDMGAYEHPSSNKLFIFCINWKPSVKRCGQDLIFSTKLATCVKPETDNDSSSSESSE